MPSKGDVLSVQYTGFKHYGIYVGENTIIHNSKKYKEVQEISLEEFSDGRSVKVSNIQAENKALAVQTAKKYVGLPYHLFSENCEHFVRTVSGLVKESVQVQKYLVLAICTGAFLKSDNSIVKTAGGAAAVATLLTPSEKSPVKNAAVLACLGAGLAFLSSLE